MTSEQFEAHVEQAMRSVTRDYEDSNAAMCVVLHQDLGLDQTPQPQDEIDAKIEAFKERYGEDWQEAVDRANQGLDLTEEHRHLHGVLDGLMGGAMMTGMDPAAMLLVVGIRLGRILAAENLAEMVDFNADDLLGGAGA
jgi:hypothetical protein